MIGHERFWRQTAKWLTTVQKDQLKLDIPKTSYALKEAVIINATAYDHQFELTNQAKGPGDHYRRERQETGTPA